MPVAALRWRTGVCLGYVRKMLAEGIAVLSVLIILVRMRLNTTRLPAGICSGDMIPDRHLYPIQSAKAGGGS